MLGNLVCPISFVRIDRNVVRTNGLITTLLLVAYVLTGSPFIIVPVALDYVFRAMMTGPTSPMTHLARWVARSLRVPPRTTDKAPKVFAARIGLCFSMGGAITHFVAPSVAPYLAGTLAFFAMLESVFDFCFGCVVYSHVALPLYRAREAVLSISRFRDLEEPMLAAVAERFQTVDLPEGSTIVKEGEIGTEMFVLRSGEVEVFHEGPDGGKLVTRYKKGEHFGEMALLSGHRRVASVRAVTAVTAFKLLKSDVDELFSKYEGMRAILEKTAAERLEQEAKA